MVLLFSKLLSPSDVQKRLAIPTDCLKHFRGGTEDISVHVPAIDGIGKVWGFNCSSRSKGSYAKPCFSRGWIQFVRYYDIRVGDLVRFYLNDENHGYRIEVHRKIKLLGCDLWSGDLTTEKRWDNFEKTTEAEVSKVETRKSIGLFGRPECSDHEKINSEKATIAADRAEEEEKESTKSDSSSTSSSGAILKSDLVFSKCLSITDLCKRMSIPFKSVKHILWEGNSSSVHLPVIDDSGQVWDFICSRRKAGFYPKPVLTGQWLRFVKCRNLRLGDRVYLYKNYEDNRYRIKVKRDDDVSFGRSWSVLQTEQGLVNNEKITEAESEVNITDGKSTPNLLSSINIQPL